MNKEYSRSDSCSLRNFCPWTDGHDQWRPISLTLSLTIYESDCIVECLPQALRSPAPHQTREREMASGSERSSYLAGGTVQYMLEESRITPSGGSVDKRDASAVEYYVTRIEIEMAYG
jgi:hypothetical protein